MNFDLYKALRENSRAATAAEQAVLLSYVGYANDEGSAWPSIDRIAHETKLSRSTVYEALRALKLSGHLCPVSAPPRVKSNAYTVAAVPVQQADPSIRRTVPVHQADFTRPVVGPNDLKKNQRRKRVARQTLEQPEPARFADLWAVYPNQVKRKPSLAAFRKLKPSDALINQIIEHVKRRALTYDWTKEGGQYVPALAAFLNQERWNDPIRGLSAVPLVPLVPVTAWRESCDHQPACTSSVEHQHRVMQPTAVNQ